MKHCACFLITAGILWSFPVQTKALEVIERVFWPTYVFVDTTDDTPNPESVALFRLTDLDVDRAVTVTTRLNGRAEELAYGEFPEIYNDTMTFVPTAPEGIVSVIKRIPDYIEPGEYTESITVMQGALDMLRDSIEVNVKTTDDDDIAIIRIFPGSGDGAPKPLRARKLSLAEGSDISSGVSDSGSDAVTLYTLANTPLTLSYSSRENLQEFTESTAENLFVVYFTQIFSGTVPPGRHRLYAEDGILVEDESYERATAVLEDRQGALLQSFVLEQNHPNPFNRGTTIPFVLPTGGDVELAVFNLAGQQVAILIDGFRTAGMYAVSWDGRDSDGQELASGVYLYRLRVGQRIEMRKLLLIQ